MHLARRFLLATSLGCVLAAHGCGEGDPEPPEKKPQVCAPHAVYTCFRSGCRGFQTCSLDGTEMSRCMCTDEPEDSGVPTDAGERDAAEPVDATTPAERCDGVRSCERPAAGGFKGPIALRLGDTETPGCDAPWETRVFEAGESPGAAAASCGACSCSAAGGGCAAFVDFGTGTQAACGGATCTTSVNQSCVEIMPPCLAGTGTAYLGTKLPAAAGSCTPSSSNPTKPEVSWARRVVGCSTEPATRDGCGSGEICLPKPVVGSASDAKLCVWREGEHDCPASRYTERHVYHRDVDDTRACSACTCSGPNCNYSWSVFNAGDTSCATPIVRLTNAGQCVQVNPSSDRLRVGATIQGDAACTASGGQSEGAVKPADPVTVCCRG